MEVQFRHLLSPLQFSRQYTLPQIRVRVSCSHPNPNRNPRSGHLARAARKKENVWSVDNEMAAESSPEGRKRPKGRPRRRRKKGEDGPAMATAAMLMEVETMLQTQEPVIKPSWNTFASSISGIWKGVGAVFSPFTAEMEPLGVGAKNENLYDCYTLSRIERVLSDGLCSSIQRKTNWVVLNPLGENSQLNSSKYRSESGKGTSDAIRMSSDLPSYESFDFTKSDVLEEDSISVEPGLVYFEDGSYSRGPVDIPVGEFDDSKYFLSPTFKFEQCLVKGCHRRLRIVHTIEFSEGGSNLQIIRVAVYEEQWVSPVNLYDENEDDQLDMKPFSQRRRIRPSELAGSWKVFEVSATPILNEEDGESAYVYLCTETLKKRTPPDAPTFFREEEALDAKDISVLWLPGGVTAYVDVTKDGVLCIGVGWYSEEGVNLVMERDYGTDGKLKEVRSKSEVKRRWTDPASP